uniref:Aminotransferase-like protein n=1 Tax=Oryza sativa subsp. japonica TaxID=39947 RepID=Q6H6F1_ORYSJ|nr:aminotransferase-like protein [Oryza sativa Japonica Group]
MSSSASPLGAPSAEYAEHLSNLVAIPSLAHESHYFLGPIGNPDPTEFIIGESNSIPFRLTNPDLASKRVHWDEIGIGQALDLTIANSAKDEPLMAAASYFWSNTTNAFLFNQGLMTPTLIDIIMITALETKRQFPLGKILLGYLNQMLSNASAKIAVGSVVGAGGPWWLLQTWLNLIVMKVVNRPSVSKTEFPRLEPIVDNDREERTHRRCTSYGEYASTPTDAGAKLLAELLKDWFCSFYEGFQKDARIWFLYEDSAQLEHPVDFRFKDINPEVYQSSKEIFSAAISPCVLPVGIHQGRNIQASYEFYHPMSSARQLGMGQLPIGLFFADKIQCRGGISSTLMMDRLLSLQGPPLGSIGNIELATFRSKTSMYMTDLFPDVVPQTTESSPPHQSNSGKDIQCAPGLIPNGGGLSPPVIGYDAPKTSTLLQGLVREPADAGKKRKTRSSAVSIIAPIKEKKTKKTKPADDLPTLDPSIEQALDEEAIGDEVDQAAAEKKKTAVKKKSAATTSKPASPPSPPPSPPVQQSSSDQTPLAAGSYHVEEEEQPAAPAIPVLADLFSFDIRDYLDEGEEDTTSKALAPLSDDVKKTLGNESADILTPAVYLEQHQFKLKKAKLRLAERRERKDIEATIQANRQLVHEEKSKLDQLSEGPIKSNIDRLEARKNELLAQLEECNAELDMEHKKLADLPKSIEEQKTRLKSAKACCRTNQVPESYPWNRCSRCPSHRRNRTD